MMENEGWLTVEEVADVAKVHEQTVRRWLRAGTLKGHLISRRAGYRIRAADLSRFLNGDSGGDLVKDKTSGLISPDR
jgi:excisionase family DNA binding protein